MVRRLPLQYPTALAVWAVYPIFLMNLKTKYIIVLKAMR